MSNYFEKIIVFATKTINVNAFMISYEYNYISSDNTKIKQNCLLREIKLENIKNQIGKHF